MTKRFSLALITLVALVTLIHPASAAVNQIAQGGDVFIGEEGLDVTAAVGGATSVAWFASGTNPNTDTPNYIVAVGTPASFYVAPADFVGRTGNWYRWTGSNQGVAFNVVDPNIDIKVWDQNANKDVTGKQVPAGNVENFRVETNTYSVVSRPSYAGEGFVNIKVKTADGATYGIGVDPEDQHKIFDKFYRTGDLMKHSTGKTKFRGGARAGAVAGEGHCGCSQRPCVG